MAKCNTDPTLNGFKLSDLLSDEGVTFEIGEQYDDDDEEFSYSPFVQFSNEEMLDMLNMNNFDDDDEEVNNGNESVSLCGISFAKLKTKMTDVNNDQKIMKFVKQEGVGEIIPHNAQVTIHYIGYFEDRDEPFDSTYSSGKPRTLRLDQNYIIPGLEIGIGTMRKHEIAVFLIHPDYAYKAIGCPPRIPPNEEVVFIVHLIDYLDNGSADTYQNLSTEEKQLYANVEKSVKHMFITAKDKVKRHNIKQAIQEYKKAVHCLETVKLQNAEEEKNMNKLLSRAYTNLGVCYNKLNMPRSACLVCNRAPLPTAKTYYNYGKGLLNLAEYRDAMVKLKIAHELSPHDEDIRLAIQEANRKQHQFLEIEKRLWKNCFKSTEEDAKITEFRKAVRDLCDIVINNKDIVRYPVPEGFLDEEHQIVREEAALLGLNVVTHLRYGKEIMYVQKQKA